MTASHKEAPRDLRRRRNTMRMFRDTIRHSAGDIFPAPAVNAQNISISVTNVTPVVPVHAHPSATPKRHPPRRQGDVSGRRLAERPPRLFRYCASGGVLDGGIAYGLESDTMCGEAVQAFGYTARQLGSSVRGMAHSACGIVEGAGKAAVGVGGICKGAFYVVAGLLGEDLA